MSKLRSFGIGTQVHYIPLPMHPYYNKLGFDIENYPNALQYYNETLTLPIYYDLTRPEQDRIIDSLKKLIL